MKAIHIKTITREEADRVMADMALKGWKLEFADSTPYGYLLTFSK